MKRRKARLRTMWENFSLRKKEEGGAPGRTNSVYSAFRTSSAKDRIRYTEELVSLTRDKNMRKKSGGDRRGVCWGKKTRAHSSTKVLIDN